MLLSKLRRYSEDELDARYLDDGEQIFENNYAITSLHYHNDADAVFSKDAADIDLPCYCLVTKAGDGNWLLNDNVITDSDSTSDSNSDSNSNSDYDYDYDSNSNSNSDFDYDFDSDFSHNYG